MADQQELRARIAELETKLSKFDFNIVGGLSAFSAGDCTNGCTGGCTDGCTGGCTGGCVAQKEEGWSELAQLQVLKSLRGEG